MLIHIYCPCTGTGFVSLHRVMDPQIRICITEHGHHSTYKKIKFNNFLQGKTEVPVYSQAQDKESVLTSKVAPHTLKRQ